MSLRAMTWAFDVRGLTPTEKVVLLALADYANDNGDCWPGQVSLAEKCDISERTIRRTINSLNEKGLVGVEDRRTPEGYRTSNRYLLALELPPAKMSASHPPTGQIEQANRPAVAATGEPSVESSDTSPTPSADDVFETLWKSWPNAKGRKPALESWRRVWKRMNSSEIATIVVAIFSHADANSKHTPPQFIPMLSTFLNQERWTDPLPVSREVGAYQADPGLRARSGTFGIPSGYLPVRDDARGHTIGYRRVDPTAPAWSAPDGLPVQL